MDKLPNILDTIVDELDSLEVLREKMIFKTRELNRLSSRGISLLVRGESANHLYEKGKELYSELHSVVDQVVHITSWKTAQAGVEEFAEFAILFHIINDQSISSTINLGIPAWIWLPALGDVVGELRRIILNRLLADKIDEAKNYLSIMQKIHQEISGLSFSKAIIPNFRKKVDSSRASIERTESDVFNYLLRKGENK